MEKIKIKNGKYNGLTCSRKVFNNYTFTDCTFKDVVFSECTFVNCTFVNCAFVNCASSSCLTNNSSFINCNFNYGSVDVSRFISCSFSCCDFFDCPVVGNEFLNCQCDGLEFTNNTQVTNNIFDGVTGNIEKCECLGINDNTFKNMDFSGFINSYYQSFSAVPSVLSRIDWVKNRFVNTTISVDAIMGLAKKAEIFGHPHPTREGFVSRFCLSVMIDMRNLSDEARFVIAANAFLRFPNIKDTNIDSNVLKCKLSCDLHLSAVDNIDAPIIVNEDGRVLKPSAIPRINVKTHFSGSMRYPTMTRDVVQIDGSEYEIDFDDSSIYEDSKHR